MASNSKRFKLKFTIPSLQMCRSKHDLSTFPINPLPAIYRLSPVNPKSHQSRHHHHPAPPPASPEHHHSHHVSSSSSNSSRSHHNAITRGRKSTSSVPSKRSNFAIDSINEEESESLISCLTSFSDDFSHDLNKTENSNRDLTNNWKISSVKKVQGVRLENRIRRLPESTMMKRSSSSASSSVKERFAVVKKTSKEPYDDFRKSMVEMITEMEISAAEDLEQLLQSFLALNSRRYHEMIVRAFMEIWQQMFIWNPASVKSLKNGGVKTDLED
ncbi:transcription repressor OFP7-like [Lotus japonicus]|uniref:transcription repressor OFP7-like n=1 Tax=Lotus japonicus TaxID=34305 RepID=UPI00258ACCFF|nr:transcription repressor OFP7-like [Lotus japonicus]